MPGALAGPAGYHDDLLDALRCAWRSICDAHDADAPLPDESALFEGADFSIPRQAAQIIVANMLLEIMGSIPRFSPLAKRPIGLRRVRDRTQAAARWTFSPAAHRRWRYLIDPLASVVEKNVGVLLAAGVLDVAAGSTAVDPGRVLAVCSCLPPRVIKAKPSALNACDVVCDACQRPFRPVKPMA